MTLTTTKKATNFLKIKRNMRDLGVIKRSSCLCDVAKSSIYMSNIIYVYIQGYKERKKERDLMVSITS